MENTLRDFQKRQAGVRKKHVRMAHGYVTKLDRNGVIVQKPDSVSKSSALFLRAFVLCGLCVFGFKVFLLAGLGSEAYGETLTTLASGSSVEQAGAWVMQEDPVSVRLADLLAPYLS